MASHEHTLAADASKLAAEHERAREAAERKQKTREMGFMYGVAKEQIAVNKLKMKMKASHFVPPAGPAKWAPPPDSVCMAAVGDTSKLTSRMQEVYNADSSLFSACPVPWDDEWLANFSDRTKGQTFDEWLALEDKTIPCGESRSHIYLCPVGSDYSPLVIKSIINVVSAFCHGCRVHELPFVPIDPSWYYNVHDWMSDDDEEENSVKEAEEERKRKKKAEREARKTRLREKKKKAKAAMQGSDGTVSSDSDEAFEEEDEKAKHYRLVREKFEQRKAEEAKARKLRHRRRKKMAARTADRVKVCVTPVLDYLRHKLNHDWHGADNAYIVLAISTYEMVDPHAALNVDNEIEILERKMNVIKTEEIEPHRKVLANAIMQGKEAREEARRVEAELNEKILKIKYEMEQLYKQADKAWEGIDECIKKDERVGMLSIAYMDPLHGMSEDEKQRANSNGRDAKNFETLIRRTSKRITHTFGHLFGMEHCIYYHCRMNGCLTAEEQENSPCYLCAVCLRKLHNAIGIHTTHRAIERYYQIRKFYGGIWRKAFPDVEDWFKERIKRIERCNDF